MRFGTLAGRLVAIQDGRALDVSAATEGRLPSDPVQALSRWTELLDWTGAADWTGARGYEVEQLGPPVPTPRQVFAVALNYHPHADEAGFEVPADPLIFTKFASCITGAHTDVQLPDGNVDWEVELVAVVGHGGYRISLAEAWAAVAGLTIGQDLSERVSQLRGRPPQFSLAKSFPGFGPTGPFLVTLDELADPDDLELSCELNGDVMQSARTSQMIFSVPDLVTRISAVVPLLPGDLIFTGTAAGVGNRREPQRFLLPGDELVSRIDGIGSMRQCFVPSAAPLPQR